MSLVPRRDSVASRKPRVLFLSQCLPYPPESGVTSRTFHIVKELQTEFDLTLLAYSRRTHQPDDAACRESERVLAGLVERVGTAYPIASELSRVRRVWDHLRSVITRRPYTFFEYESEHFRQQLRAVTRQTRFDLVHIDSLDLYRWLNELPVVPTVCTHHSIESQLLRLQAQRVDSRVLGRYMRWQADLMEGVERERCPKFSLNVMMSPIDADKLRALAPSATTIVVPNGVDTAYFAPRVEIPSLFGSVVFVGSMGTFPNQDAMEYFLRDIWPSVRHATREASLKLIGRLPGSQRTRYETAPGVTSLGHVPDIRPHLAEASCCVVPLRVGGGTRLKILDAWAMGKAVVSTSIGCEGLGAVDGKNILIRDDAAGFAAAVVAVLNDSRLREQLELNARVTAATLYSWPIVGRNMRAEYWHVIDAGRHVPCEGRQSLSLT